MEKNEGFYNRLSLSDGYTPGKMNTQKRNRKNWSFATAKYPFKGESPAAADENAGKGAYLPSGEKRKFLQPFALSGLRSGGQNGGEKEYLGERCTRRMHELCQEF